MFGLWILLQFPGIYLQLNGFSHVAATAHLGGAAAGALWWVVTRKVDVR